MAEAVVPFNAFHAGDRRICFQQPGASAPLDHTAEPPDSLAALEQHLFTSKSFLEQSPARVLKEQPEAEERKTCGRNTWQPQKGPVAGEQSDWKERYGG